MTMNGVHNEASAPLDLRTTTRDITDRTTKQTKTRETIDRTPKTEEVESTSRRSFPLSPAIQQGSKECQGSQCQAFGVPVKCKLLIDSDGKSSETPTSKLPIRKRPVRPDPKPLDRAESKGVEPPCKVVKTDSSLCPAEVPKCSSVRKRLNAESLQFLTASIPSAARSNTQRAQSTPAYYSFCQSQLTSKTLSPPHPHEDIDRLQHEVVLATHQDEDGDTALHIAVAKENEALVFWLICILCQAHRNLDLYNKLRQTPLHLAVITHQPGVVQALLQGGADPGALDRNGQTALHLCCEHQQDACLQIILSHLLLLPYSTSACLDSRNFEGLTPLHLVVQDGNRKMAKMLLDSGADINAVDIKSGCSPLIHAVEKSCIEMINFLVENGCSVNSQSYSGNTALHIACGRGEVEAVRILLKNGADSSLKNYHNDTAVMVAKNKKVSDVLRGKPTRAHHLQTQNSFNDFPSSNNLSVSPLTTPNAHRSASSSPKAPHSQFGGSRSGNLSPVEPQEAENLLMTSMNFHDISAAKNADYVLSIYPIFCAPPYDALVPSNPHIHLMPGHSPYYPNVVPRHHYAPDPQYMLIPARNVAHASHPSPSHPTGTQLRPSSHNSDQTDISNSSANTEEKT